MMNHSETSAEKFIRHTAQDVYKGLTPGDKKYLRQYPETWEHKQGLGAYIRRHYITGKKLDFYCADEEVLSSRIVSSVILMVKEE